MLQINTREAGPITVLELRGNLVSGLGLDALRQRLEQLVAEQRTKIVLNAWGVSIIDSRGIGDLVATYNLLKKSGGGLTIANPSKIVQDVLRIARLPTIIGVYDTEEAAVKSFAS